MRNSEFEIDFVPQIYGESLFPQGDSVSVRWKYTKLCEFSVGAGRPSHTARCLCNK